MKKAMILPLLVGMVWVCGATPVTHNQKPDRLTVSARSISADLLKQIFEAASRGYKTEYGITVSAAELQLGYEVGTVFVNEIDEDTWEVIYSGNPLIVDSEDFL